MEIKIKKIINNLLFVWNNFFVSKYFNRIMDDYFWEQKEEITRKYIFNDKYYNWEITEEDKCIFLEEETKKFLSIQLFLANNIEFITEKQELSIYFDLNWLWYIIWLLDFLELYTNTNELWNIWWNTPNLKIYIKDKDLHNFVNYWNNKLFWDIFKEINFLEDWWYQKSRINIELINESNYFDLWIIDSNIDPEKDKYNLSKTENIFIIDSKSIIWNSVTNNFNYKTVFVKKPTRTNLRYFMYRYFWAKDKNWSKFDRFSEERQDSVNLLEIFDEDLKKEHTKEINGHTEEKWWQYEILASILQGKNTLWILSTWWWKSLMYQLSSILLSWTTIVVSPLKSLMEDQFANMKNFWFENIVSRIHSWLSDDAKEKELLKMKSWNLKLIYVSPERFQIESFVKQLLENYVENISIFTVDEAHCLSERWHDFRFSYLNLGFFVESLRSQETKIPVLALTATASPMAKKDIINFLWIEKYIEESSINRTNISMEIIPVDKWDDKRDILIEYMKDKMNRILENVANMENKPYNWIFEQNEEWKFSKWWLIFTIYWAIKNKTSGASISSTAFDIYKFLIKNLPEYKDDFMFYFSDLPDSLTYDTCPECWSENVITNTKDYILFCNKCQKFCKFLPPKDWIRRKSCCNQEFNKMIDEKYKNVHWWCNNCLKPFREPFKVAINNVYIWKEFSDVNRENEKELRNLWETQRIAIQDSFKNNDLAALVSTKGFWMGIDKPNISFVIHYVLSSSLEQYYQEIWRAWRNKEHAHSVILFNWPCDECIEETNNFSNMQIPECMRNPETLKYKRCPYDNSPMCDLWRQLCMIKSPLTIWENSNLEFLDDELEAFDWNDWSLKEYLIGNISSGFTSALTEFWQVYIFYRENIKWKKWIIEIHTNNDFIEEKLIYRLLCMWIIEKYYKNYKDWTFKLILKDTNYNNYNDNVKNFLKNKVWEIEWIIIDSDDINTIHRASWWDKELELFAESLMFLLKTIYEKVEYWRLQQLIHLYNSIQLSEQWECFRWHILRRLLWTTQDNLWKCGFCSWCNKDAEHYNVIRWNMAIDKELKKINTIFKKKLKWEAISEEDEKKLQEQTKKNIWLIRFKDKVDAFLTGIWDETSTTKLIDILEQSKANKLNISWDVEKILDSWHAWLNVLLMDSCLKIKTRTELAQQNIKRIVWNYLNNKGTSILGSIIKSYWKDDDLNDVIDIIYDEVSNSIKSIEDPILKEKIYWIRDIYLMKKLWEDKYIKYLNILNLFYQNSKK